MKTTPQLRLRALWSIPRTTRTATRGAALARKIEDDNEDEEEEKEDDEESQQPAPAMKTQLLDLVPKVHKKNTAASEDKPPISTVPPA